MKANVVAIDLTEFKLGWRIVLLAMLGLGVNANASMLYAFGTLVIPLQKAFGWTRGDLQSSISFLFAGAVVGSQLVGWLNQRYGMNRVTQVSLIALALTFAAIPWMGSSIAWLYLFFGQGWTREEAETEGPGDQGDSDKVGSGEEAGHGFSLRDGGFLYRPLRVA